MPRNCYHEIYLHMTWHTKDNARLLTGDVETRAHRYIVQRIAETPGAFVHEIGGTEDHIHVAVNVPPTLLISDWIGELKGASTHHLNHNVMARPMFAWQTGYGVLSFGKKDLPFVVEYKSASLLGAERTAISLMELFHLPAPYSSGLLFSSQPSSPAAFPGPLPPPLSRSRSFLCASGTARQSDYWQSIVRLFAFAYRLTCSRATRRLCQSS